MHLLIRFVINAVALWCIAKFVPGFNHDITVAGALIAALIFGLVNALIGPILRLMSLPLTWITHGLFSFVVNYILFAITVWIAPGFKTTGEINQWLAYLYGALIMTLVSTLVQQVSKSEAEQSATTTSS